MPNDPLSMDDPSHPLHGMSAGFAEMRQRRQAYDARQQMMAQVLAASPGGMLGGNAAMVPLSASGWGGATPGWAGAGQGLTGLASAMGQGGAVPSPGKMPMDGGMKLPIGGA